MPGVSGGCLPICISVSGSAGLIHGEEYSGFG